MRCGVLFSIMFWTFDQMCKSKQIFGVGKDFCPISPKFARKVFVRLLPTNFLTKIMKTFFWYNLQEKVLIWHPKNKKVLIWHLKKVIVCFSKVGNHFFKSKNVERHFSRNLLRFSESFPGFSTNQTFLASTCTPCTPASYTTAFHVAFAITEL